LVTKRIVIHEVACVKPSSERYESRRRHKTDTVSRAALARMEKTGGLTTSQANWLDFCTASLRFGSGKQIY
jgi:hypothetical protein